MLENATNEAGIENEFGRENPVGEIGPHVEIVNVENDPTGNEIFEGINFVLVNDTLNRTPIPNIYQNDGEIFIENFDPNAMLENGTNETGNADNECTNIVLVNDTLNRQRAAVAQENGLCARDPLQIPVDPNATNEADEHNGASIDTVKIEPIPSITIVNAEALMELMRQAHRAGPSTSASFEGGVDNNQDDDSDDVICLTEQEIVETVKPMMEPNYGLIKQKDDLFSGDTPFRQLVNRFCWNLKISSY